MDFCVGVRLGVRRRCGRLTCAGVMMRKWVFVVAVALMGAANVGDARAQAPSERHRETTDAIVRAIWIDSGALARQLGGASVEPPFLQLGVYRSEAYTRLRGRVRRSVDAYLDTIGDSLDREAETLAPALVEQQAADVADMLTPDDTAAFAAFLATEHGAAFARQAWRLNIEDRGNFQMIASLAPEAHRAAILAFAATDAGRAYSAQAPQLFDRMGDRVWPMLDVQGPLLRRRILTELCDVFGPTCPFVAELAQPG